MDQTQSKLEDFRRLLKMDEVVQNCVAFVTKETYLADFPYNNGIVQNINIAGSCVEGCVLARFFFPSEDFDDKINCEFESDIDLHIVTIPKLRENDLNDVPNKLGFAKVFVSDIKEISEVVAQLNKHVEMLTHVKQSIKPDDFVNEESFLNTRTIKDVMV